MALPLPHVLAGAAVIIGGVSLYEFVFKKKSVAPGEAVPSATPVADAASSAVSAVTSAVTGVAGKVASVVTGKPAAPTPGTLVPGRVAGYDPRFLAAHPGWKKGDKIKKRPMAPKARTATGAALVNGQPVMTGDAIADAIHALGFHGYRKTDMPIYVLAQQKLGLKPDGLPGPTTMAALMAAAVQKGIPTPTLQTFAFKDASTLPPSWLSTT